jgi:8-oxo-dGTP pyrophosphatase MutT (NUDIX family)
VKPGKIRPLAICVFRHEDRIFAAEGYDPIKQQKFYRPLGGKIEFGEYGHQTVIRELEEEIHQPVKDLRYLGTLENIFTYNGQTGHEIVLIYDGAFVDESMYTRESVEGWEDDDNLLFVAYWKTLDFFQRGEAPLYPTGLVDLLLKDTTK